MGRNKLPIRKRWLEKFEKSNLKIALNVLYAKINKTYLAYVLKYNLKREGQVILLMITNKKGWYYIAVKNYQHNWWE